jgi:hypothetical protein
MPSDAKSWRFPALKLKRFDGTNTRCFLQDYEALLDQNEDIPDSVKVKNVIVYMEEDHRDRVQGWEEWKSRDWAKLKERMLQDFIDEDKRKYRKEDLNKVARKWEKLGGPDNPNELIDYHLKFTTISEYLKDHKKISSDEEFKVFMTGLGDEHVDRIREWKHLDRVMKRAGKEAGEAQVKEGARMTVAGVV